MTERSARIGRVAAARPLRQALTDWQAAVVLLDGIDPITTELVRLRCAHHHDCHTCKSVRLVAARDRGLDEATIVDAERSGASLPPAQRAARALADAMMSSPGELPAGLAEELHEHFSDRELLELTLDVMKWNYQKVPVSLGVDFEVRPGELAELRFDEDGHWVRPAPVPTATGSGS